MHGNRNTPSWLLKDMGYQQDSSSSQNSISFPQEIKQNAIAQRTERARAFLQRKLNRSSSFERSRTASLKEQDNDEDVGTYRKGDRVRVLRGKRKGKLGRILGKGRKSKSKWRVRVGGKDIVEYEESNLEKFQKSLQPKELLKGVVKEKKGLGRSRKPRQLSITVKRARRASQERFRRRSSASTPPSSDTIVQTETNIYHHQRQRSSGSQIDSISTSLRRPKSENVSPSKYQLRYSLKHIRKHKSYPRRLRSKNSRPPIPQWVLQEMGRSSDSGLSLDIVAPVQRKEIPLRSSLSDNSVLSGASPLSTPSPPISPSIPSDRSSWKRRISQRVVSSSKRSSSSPKKKKMKKQPPPIPQHYRTRTRSDGRSRRSLKEILSGSDILSPHQEENNDSSELENCWHTIQEIATSEMKHLHFMIMLRDLYFEPLRRIDADDRGGQHTNMSTDRLRVVSSMLESGWQHTDAEALFRGLESVQDMSSEIVTVLRPLLNDSIPVSSRSRLLRNVMSEFLKRVSSPDEDSMSPLSGAYLDFCANTPFATRKLTSLSTRQGLGEAFQKYLKMQRARQADMLISLGAHNDRDRPSLQIIRLDAVLIKPVQRIGRYQLLLNDVLRHLPEHHSTREILERCREAAARSAADVDDIVANTEEAARLWSVYERLSVRRYSSTSMLERETQESFLPPSPSLFSFSAHSNIRTQNLKHSSQLDTKVPQIDDENTTDESTRIVSATTSLPTHLLAQRDQLVSVLRRLVTPHRRFLREMNVLLAFDCYSCSKYHDNHSRECVSCGASYCVSCKKKYMHKLATKTWKCTRCNVREEMRRVTGFSVSSGGVGSSNQMNTPAYSTSTTPQISLKHAKSLRSVLLGGGKISKNPTLQRSFYRNLLGFDQQDEEEKEEEKLVPSPTFDQTNSTDFDAYKDVVDRMVEDDEEILDEDTRAAENFASQFDFSGDSTSDSSISVGMETPTGRPRRPDDSIAHRRRVLVFSDFFFVASARETSNSWFFNYYSRHEGEGANLELDIHVPPIHLGRTESRPRVRSRLASLRDRRHEPKLPSNAIRIVPPAFAWGRRQRATSSFLQLNADGARSSGYSFVIWCESDEDKEMLWRAMGRK